MSRLDLLTVLPALAERRPIFHSEKDFQHELAWEIRARIPDSQIRLEMPIDDFRAGAIDLVVIRGSQRMGIELKYCRKTAGIEYDGELFALKQHGAHPLRRYDICKDVSRMEDFRAQPNSSAAVVVLTNDPSYWQGVGTGTVCEQFRLEEGRTLSGILGWSDAASDGTRKGRATSISLKHSYQMNWVDYSDLGVPNGRFRCLHIPID